MRTKSSKKVIKNFGGERGHENADAIKRVRDVLSTALKKSVALSEAARDKRMRISCSETTASATIRMNSETSLKLISKALRMRDKAAEAVLSASSWRPWLFPAPTYYKHLSQPRAWPYQYVAAVSLDGTSRACL